MHRERGYIGDSASGLVETLHSRRTNHANQFNHINPSLDFQPPPPFYFRHKYSSTMPSASPASAGSPPSPWPPIAMPLSDFAAGAAAGGAQVIVGQPLDTVRVRMQTAPRGTFNGTWDVLAKTVRYEGITGLFKGELSSGLPYDPRQ